jgi:LysR family hydrogen peroxide-inducible transcriptional activator
MAANKMNLPSPKQLRYFLALADEAHFGRAAAICFVSQSAFSVAIKELETLLGVRLVDRTNRQVTVTAMGQEFARQARECVQALESLVESARGQREPLVGELRLGVIPTVAPFLLPQVLPKLRRAYPKLRLYLVEDQTQRLHARLASGEIDLALLALPYELRGMEVLPLFKDHFRLACREGSALVKPGASRMALLDPASVLLLEDGHCLRDQALDVCGRIDVREAQDFRATSLETLRQMVAAGLGITLLPELATEGPFAQGRNLAVRPFAKPVPRRTIGAVWRRSSTRIPAVAAVCDVIAETVRKP